MIGSLSKRNFKYHKLKNNLKDNDNPLFQIKDQLAYQTMKHLSITDAIKISRNLPPNLKFINLPEEYWNNLGAKSCAHFKDIVNGFSDKHKILLHEMFQGNIKIPENVFYNGCKTKLTVLDYIKEVDMWQQSKSIAIREDCAIYIGLLSQEYLETNLSVMQKNAILDCDFSIIAVRENFINLEQLSTLTPNQIKLSFESDTIINLIRKNTIDMNTWIKLSDEQMQAVLNKIKLITRINLTELTKLNYEKTKLYLHLIEFGISDV